MARRRTPEFGEQYTARLRTERTAIAELERYVEARVKSGHIVGTEWNGTPLLETPPPVPLEFRWHRVDRVLTSFARSRQLIGQWSGRPFILLDSQVRYIIAPVFGWTHPDGRRIIRTVWDEIPRKNGKSTLASGAALYLFGDDGENTPQVAAAAADRSQAGLVFKPSRAMAEASPYWRRKFGDDLRTHVIECNGGAGWFKAVSADGARQQGLNLHAAIVDEVHVHKSPDLIDALETGTGSREQPLTMFITTADDGADGSIYSTKREYLEGIVAGSIVDPTFRGVVFGADKSAEDFDPFHIDTIRNANPGIGQTVHEDYLIGKAEEARQSPAQLNRYLRLHLNVRTKQLDRWLPLDRWDHGAQALDLEHAFNGRQCFGGLDLSSSSDFTAFALLAPIPPEDRPELADLDELILDEEGNPVLAGLDEELDAGLERVARAAGYYLDVLHWLPEERIAELDRKLGVPLEEWVADGWLIATEGNVVDYAKVRADIDARVELLGAQLHEVAFDPWNASETVQEMQNRGRTMVPLRQGFASLSAPCKELERLVMGSTADLPLLIHGGNPVLRWAADNVAVLADPGGNLKPSKPDRHKSTKRIDGIAATVNALARAMLRPPPKKKKRAYGF